MLHLLLPHLRKWHIKEPTAKATLKEDLKKSELFSLETKAIEGHFPLNLDKKIDQTHKESSHIDQQNTIKLVKTLLAHLSENLSED